MEDRIERTKRVEKKNTALVYIIVIIFITLGATAFLLYRSMEEVRVLESHKKVLMDRLGEEVLAKRKLQRQTDSLKKFVETNDPVPISSDLQEFN